MVPATLVLTGVDIRYQASVDAVRDLSLTVPRGGIVALLGANGAGKSSTLNAISGFLPLLRGRMMAGRISFEGEDTAGLAPHALVRRGVLHVREGRHVFADMTVEENLVAGTFALTGRRAVHRRGFDEVYGYFPILAQRRKGQAGYLSGGEQQMLAIGRALLTNPRLLILDEATEGLAPLIRLEIWRCLEQVRARGQAILVIDKNLDHLLRIADRHFIVEKGQVVWNGTSAEFLAQPELRARYMGV